MAAQRGFAFGLVTPLQFRRHIRHDQNIRRNAFGLNRAARRRVIARRCQTQGSVAAQRNDGLHGPFSERACAHQSGALVILQSACDNFRGRGRPTIDHDDNRLAIGQITGASGIALALIGIAPAGGDNLTALQKSIRHRNRLIQQTAGIVAQIDHIAFELAVGHFGADLLDGLFQIFKCLLAELGDPDIADIFFNARAHGTDPDGVAHQGDLDRIIIAFAHQFQPHGCIDRPAHFIDRLIERQTLHLLVIDLHDEITRQQTGTGGGRVVNRRHHLQDAVFHRDLDAETAEFTAGLDLHIPIAFGIHEAGMRIKGGQHAIDGRLDQLAIIRFLDVIGPNLFKNIAEQIQLAIDIAACGNGGTADVCLRNNGRCHNTQHHADEDERNFAHHPRTFSVRGDAHHGAGSMEIPSLRNST